MPSIDIECMPVHVYTNDHNEDHNEFILADTVVVQIITKQEGKDERSEHSSNNRISTQ